jgi:molybdenum cofactor synthesis domain-containing protein
MAGGEGRMAGRMSETEDVTAGILVIGDEILSGRTKDGNSGYIAEYLTGLGIALREVRVVPDVEARIVEALNALRAAYTYVFTTGGIGPTHDDITADAVAKAFGVAIDEDPRALALLAERIPAKDLNPARRRMARIPAGAELIENPVSKAPGFRIGNVFVMAGVPAIMHAMLDNAAPRLKTGTPLTVRTVSTDIREGDAAEPLRAIQAAHPKVAIGSYPYYRPTGFGTNIVCRGKDPDEVETVAEAVVAAFLAAGASAAVERG